MHKFVLIYREIDFIVFSLKNVEMEIYLDKSQIQFVSAEYSHVNINDAMQQEKVF